MQITSRLTVAAHTLAVAEYFKNSNKVTSDFIAASVGVNPVVIRRILLQLKEAGLIDVARGSGGASLKKPPEDITLYDIYCAVDCVEEDGLFHFHEHPNPDCPVGKSIHTALDGYLSAAQQAMENSLKGVTLADVMSSFVRA